MSLERGVVCRHNNVLGNHVYFIAISDRPDNYYRCWRAMTGNTKGAYEVICSEHYLVVVPDDELPHDILRLASIVALGGSPLDITP